MPGDPDSICSAFVRWISGWSEGNCCNKSKLFTFTFGEITITRSQEQDPNNKGKWGLYYEGILSETPRKWVPIKKSNIISLTFWGLIWVFNGRRKLCLVIRTTVGVVASAHFLLGFSSEKDHCCEFLAKKTSRKNLTPNLLKHLAHTWLVVQILATKSLTSSGPPKICDKTGWKILTNSGSPTPFWLVAAHGEGGNPPPVHLEK